MTQGLGRGDALDDATLCARLARSTGDILTSIRTAGAPDPLLVDSDGLGKSGDKVAQAWIARVLSLHRPDDAILSEEAEDDPSRLDKSRVWVIDPLDGTREYASARNDWAVHIALTVDGEVVESAVGMPEMHTVYTAADYREGRAKADFGELNNRLVISQNSTPQIAVDVAEDLGMEITRLGSCGAKAMSVVRGDNDAYIHAGGQYEWDNAAPIGVALAAGLHCSRLDGTPATYNEPDPYLPDLVICRKEIAEDLLASIQKFL